MADTAVDDTFVNAQYGDGGGSAEEQVVVVDQQVVATSWFCEYCEVENGLDTTECAGCGYDYAAADVVSEFGALTH